MDVFDLGLVGLVLERRGESVFLHDYYDYPTNCLTLKRFSSFVTFSMLIGTFGGSQGLNCGQVPL